MKQILFFLAMLPLAASAQKLQVGLNAGGQYNVPNRIVGESGRVNGYISARALLDIGRHLQLGFTMDAGKFTLRSGMDIYTNESYTKRNNLIRSNGTYIAPALVANFKGQFLKGYLYGGLALGYFKTFKDKGDVKLITTYTSDPNYPVKEELVGTKMAYGPYTWLLPGAQVGYTMSLTDRLGVNAEAAFRWGRETESPFFMQRRVKFIPVSIGIRYALGGNKKTLQKDTEEPAQQ
jgi:hypothetical protein